MPDEIAVVIVTPDGSVQLSMVKPTVRTYGAIVGGYFEAIGVADRWVCYLNEEGKVHDLPRNDRATIAWEALGFVGLPGDYCAGWAFFCGPPDEEGGDTDVTAEVLAHFGLLELLG